MVQVFSSVRCVTNVTLAPNALKETKDCHRRSYIHTSAHFCAIGNLASVSSTVPWQVNGLLTSLLPLLVIHREALYRVICDSRILFFKSKILNHVLKLNFLDFAQDLPNVAVKRCKSSKLVPQPWTCSKILKPFLMPEVHVLQCISSVSIMYSVV